MIYKGIWSSATAYVVNDVVLLNYKYYIALAAGTNLNPESNPATWEIYSVINSICYIISTFIGLAQDRIFIYNQDYKFPTDPNLFIVVEFKSAEDIASNNRQFGEPGEDTGMQEQISTLTRETYTINVLSKSNAARLNLARIRAALTSALAQQQQEIFQYQIGYVSKNILNISEVEGSGMLNRFAFDIAVTTWFAEDRSADYFDQFSKEILTEDQE